MLKKSDVKSKFRPLTSLPSAAVWMWKCRLMPGTEGAQGASVGEVSCNFGTELSF